MKANKEISKCWGALGYTDISDTMLEEGCPKCGYDKPMLDNALSHEEGKLILWASICNKCGQRWTDFFTFEGRMAKINKEN